MFTPMNEALVRLRESVYTVSPSRVYLRNSCGNTASIGMTTRFQM